MGFDIRYLKTMWLHESISSTHHFKGEPLYPGRSQKTCIKPTYIIIFHQYTTAGKRFFSIDKSSCIHIISLSVIAFPIPVILVCFAPIPVLIVAVVPFVIPIAFAISIVLFLL